MPHGEPRELCCCCLGSCTTERSGRRLRSEKAFCGSGRWKQGGSTGVRNPPSACESAPARETVPALQERSGSRVPFFPPCPSGSSPIPARGPARDVVRHPTKRRAPPLRQPFTAVQVRASFRTTWDGSAPTSGGPEPAQGSLPSRASAHGRTDVHGTWTSTARGHQPHTETNGHPTPPERRDGQICHDPDNPIARAHPTPPTAITAPRPWPSPPPHPAGPGRHDPGARSGRLGRWRGEGPRHAHEARQPHLPVLAGRAHRHR